MMATIISRRMISVIIMQHVSLREHFYEGGVGVGRDKRWLQWVLEETRWLQSVLGETRGGYSGILYTSAR